MGLTTYFYRPNSPLQVNKRQKMFKKKKNIIICPSQHLPSQQSAEKRFGDSLEDTDLPVNAPLSQRLLVFCLGPLEVWRKHRLFGATQILLVNLSLLKILSLVQFLHISWLACLLEVACQLSFGSLNFLQKMQSSRRGQTQVHTPTQHEAIWQRPEMAKQVVR